MERERLEKREKQREKERKGEKKMFRVNYYQSAFNSQKELNVLAEMLEISKTGLDLQQHTITIRAPVGANNIYTICIFRCASIS